MKKLEIVISQELKPEDINDLVSTALEGGINYWCGRATQKYSNPDDENDSTHVGVAPEDEKNIEYASDVIGYGGSLILDDAEASKDELTKEFPEGTPESHKHRWELTLDKMLKGITQHCTTKGITPAELMDDYDADDSDAIVQYALFGELVFG